MADSLQHLKLAFLSDGTNVSEPELTAEDRKNGIVLYQGFRALAIRNGDYITYVHADELSQEELGIEWSPEHSQENPRKRAASESGGSSSKSEVTEGHVSGMNLLQIFCDTMTYLSNRR